MTKDELKQAANFEPYKAAAHDHRHGAARRVRRRQRRLRALSKLSS